ncbi:DUF4190 domain-containing protein [Pseudonocardia endophytica]|uniref:DUF4190 domain-containing protein n=1 Tax=Pseudonocardia endophytica TaxID=401976 RepID=UPI00104CCC6A|nr:DUF4190 domain-containing protein [Pseudonocardia endophytica]
MTTSQQPRPGRHARPDDSDGSLPSGPSSLPPVPRPRTVGEYVTSTQVEQTGPIGPGFGEWPFGPRRQADGGREPVGDEDDEFAGQNPYLPCEEEAAEVRLAPGGLPGTLALVAGVVGIGLALVPFIAIAVWPVTILGLVLGFVGLRRVRAGSARNSVVAVAGIVLSAVGLALCVTWLSLFAVVGVGSAQDLIERTPIPVLVR